ncbi:hypothetical protein [Paracoccus saliphilus]|uniref:Uncharacterized protein n=1 Tax=Paracoccus saliphilus TaxID=405559 RepID=A0ABY7S6J4_9RHOB|nr:hypothetical protein [Paracoccus saliphilus]WCR02258.1 hypothetical protein JHX88_15375 [Paracoccus saliphilus]
MVVWTSHSNTAEQRVVLALEVFLAGSRCAGGLRRASRGLGDHQEKHNPEDSETDKKYPKNHSQSVEKVKR